MTPLQDVIYIYTQEHLLRRLLGEDNAALHRSEREAEELIERLKALGGETGARLTELDILLHIGDQESTDRLAG